MEDRNGFWPGRPGTWVWRYIKGGMLSYASVVDTGGALHATEDYEWWRGEFYQMGPLEEIIGNAEWPTTPNQGVEGEPQ